MSHLPALSLLLVSALACTTAGANAAPDTERGDDRFPISVESIEARRAAVFAEVDGDGDGLISKSEFDAHEPPRHHGGPWMFGPSGHRPRGEAPEERMAAMDQSLFEALDANADGVLSSSEFSQAALADARRNLIKTQIFEHLDSDGDGYLAPSEFPPARMAGLDANGDGQITRDELPARRGPRTD
jgi:Ca2+-binding EF-hand superfamily protein